MKRYTKNKKKKIEKIYQEPKKKEKLKRYTKKNYQKRTDYLSI